MIDNIERSITMFLVLIAFSRRKQDTGITITEIIIISKLRKAKRDVHNLKSSKSTKLRNKWINLQIGSFWERTFWLRILGFWTSVEKRRHLSLPTNGPNPFIYWYKKTKIKRKNKPFWHCHRWSSADLIRLKSKHFDDCMSVTMVCLCIIDRGLLRRRRHCDDETCFCLCEKGLKGYQYGNKIACP